MKRKLFCEISPLTYKISLEKEKLKRRGQNLWNGPFATQISRAPLPISLVKHSSLIRRKLGNVDLQLQENKAVNLSLAVPHVNGVLIRPGEIFSFWRLVGECSAKKGFKTGLTIEKGRPAQGVGGGMCQFTNLIHWMILHSPLDIIEHHHHNDLDLFPDYQRQIPFGVGTSIVYNFLDYRFKNNTRSVFQLLVHTDDEYLHGELRTDYPLEVTYHIRVANEFFEQSGATYYRNNEIFRTTIDKKTGNILRQELIIKNHAQVMYDLSDAQKLELEMGKTPGITS
jgi:vancomycin resistance protein VanW